MAKSVSKNCPVPAGILLAIGGKEDKGDGGRDDVPAENFQDEEILKTFCGLIRKKNPVIEVITTATSEPEDTFNQYKKLFNGLGLKNISQIHHKTRKEVLDDPDPLMERLKAADAFFFAGGDQLLLTGMYGGSEFLIELKKRYIREKIVIAGTSAGAMAMSTPMIYAGSKEVEETAGEIKITTGLEFLRDVCIDTHFVHRGRFVRMAQVVVTNPTSVGIGLEEDTAIIIRKGSEAEVIGSGMIVIIEGFHIAEANLREFTSKKAVSVRDLRVHLLARGDKYSIPQFNPPHQ